MEKRFMPARLDRVSVEQVESNPILDYQQPLSEESAEWKELKQRLQPGDEIWTFRDPRDYKGLRGLLLVRDGRMAWICYTPRKPKPAV